MNRIKNIAKIIEHDVLVILIIAAVLGTIGGLILSRQDAADSTSGDGKANIEFALSYSETASSLPQQDNVKEDFLMNGNELKYYKIPENSRSEYILNDSQIKNISGLIDRLDKNEPPLPAGTINPSKRAVFIGFTMRQPVEYSFNFHSHVELSDSRNYNVLLELLQQLRKITSEAS